MLWWMMFSLFIRTFLVIVDDVFFSFFFFIDCG
jgi:hypothetical protein